jgi:5-deoxy-glucuronate isomerase
MGLEYISAQRLDIAGSAVVDSGEEEACLVCLYGGLEYRAPRISGSACTSNMLYLPRRTTIELQALSETVVMGFGAPADSDTRFAQLAFATVDTDPARRLMVGLCRGDVGGWAAWPPHEHASKREEVYVYFDMGRAFGVQCVYEDLDHPLAVTLVTEGDLVSFPRGHHPSVACPVGRMSHVYCMAAKQPSDRNFMDLNIQAVYGDKFE